MNELEFFNQIGDWIKANPLLSGAIGAVLCLVIGFIKPERVKIVGRAFSDLLKRIPIVGPLLEKKIEIIVDNFEDGMKQDEANVFSPNMPAPKLFYNETKKQLEVVTDPLPDSNECPSSTENKSNGE